MAELLVSDDVANDSDALRERMRSDGYVLVRELVDPTLVATAAAEARVALSAAGWTDATGRPGPVRQPDWQDPGYRGFGLAPSVNRLAYEPGPQHVMKLLLGEGAFVYPVKVPRAVYPERVAPDHKGRFVHQDYRVIGKQDLFTMWLPLMDIPLELGPLAVRPGSSRMGWAPPHRLAPGAPDWSTTHFRPGDALVFHCLTWHAALPNRTDDIRLSVDVRWQLAQESAPSRLIYGPGGPGSTGGGELLRRVFGTQPWWHPVPDGVTAVESTAPLAGQPIPLSRYVDFPTGQRQPPDRVSH